MKKTVFAAFALAALALVSCNKEEAPEIQNKSGITTLIANLPEDVDTKMGANLNGGKYLVFWLTTDEIGLYKADNSTTTPDVTLKVQELIGSSQKIASFVVTEGEIDGSAAYTAVYPKNAGGNAAVWKTFLAGTPSLATPQRMIMSAEMPAGQTMLNFSNKCAIFRVQFPAPPTGMKYSKAIISGAWGSDSYPYDGSTLWGLKKASFVTPLVDDAADVVLNLAVISYNTEDKTLGCQQVYTLPVKANAKVEAKFYEINASSMTPTSSQDWVDLGLPSGTLWATCNLGATTPEGKGNYYGWGMKEPYDISTDSANWTTYFQKIGGSGTSSAACGTADDPLKEYLYGGSKFNVASSAGTADGIGGTEWDAARKTLKGSWRMPSAKEFEELYNSDNCTWTSETIDGVSVRTFTSKTNGKSISIPWAGGINLSNILTGGYYWSSTAFNGANNYAHYLSFGAGSCLVRNEERYFGFPIRPVMK
ncbi:MAG: hypothetical protein HUJ89_07615 [Bacteroidales bacterium]|nr:hypothetical protein [Bacteroidales bacterium]